ncbi:MAG TPA: MBL fold metallo-hydrolase [Streptosporangiaceae bacterium]|nr:MBL fold metallo-hydrolase [Streptosporangiaceae bacterium]
MTRTSEGDRPADCTAPGTYEVAASVYRIPLPLPSDGLRAVNVYAIDHGDSLTLIDAGWAVAQTTPALESGLAALGRSFTDISRILVTHVHRDHYSHAVLLRERWGTHIALGAGEADTLRAVRRMGEGEQENTSLPRLRAAGAADLAAAIAAGPRPPHTLEFWQPPDEWLTGGQQIALPGRMLESISTPGHTRGHLVYRDAAARALFAGDHILPRITPSIGFEAAPSPSPLAAYLRSLALVRDLPDATLLPAHGPVADSVHARVDELLAHHEQRLAASAAAVADGAHTGWEVARQLRWTRRERKLDELDPFNQMLAVLETVAHLTVLVAQGALTQTRIDGVDHYQT